MTLDDQLRDALRAESRTLPGWTDPVARVRAGMRRRQRRRIVVAAGLALVLGAGAVAAGLARGPDPVPPADPAPLPWVDRSTEPPVGPALPLRPTARPCDPSDLSPTASGSHNGAAGGTLYAHITVTNGSSTQCTLQGVPALVSAGRTVSTDEDYEELKNAEAPATINPGESAFVRLKASSGCPGSPAAYRDLAIGPGIPVRDLVLESSCVLKISRWHRVVVEEPSVRARYGALRASIDAPPSVARGGELVYVVTLENPSGQPFTLRPCPVYQQTFGKAGGTYLLNCTVTAVPARGGLRYEMRLRVAPDADLGRTPLNWVLLDGWNGEPAAQSTVDVVPAAPARRDCATTSEADLTPWLSGAVSAGPVTFVPQEYRLGDRTLPTRERLPDGRYWIYMTLLVDTGVVVTLSIPPDVDAGLGFADGFPREVTFGCQGAARQIQFPGAFVIRQAGCVPVDVIWADRRARVVLDLGQGGC